MPLMVGKIICVLAELASQFRRAQGKTSQIRISAGLDREIIQLIDGLDVGQRFAQTSIEPIIESLEHNGVSSCGRCTNRTLIALFFVLRHSTPCTAVERGYHLLLVWLTGNAPSRLRTRKKELEIEIFSHALDGFCNSRVDVTTRLWLGVLILCILKNGHSKCHAQLIMDEHSSSVGKICSDDTSPLLRLICGLIIRNLAREKHHKRLFWPQEWSPSIEQALTSIPPLSGWVGEFLYLQEKSIDRNFKYATPFQCSSVAIPDLGSQNDVGNTEFIFASVEDHLTIIIMHSSKQSPDIIQVAFEALERAVVEFSPQECVKMSRSTFSVVLRLKTDENSRVFVDGKKQTCSFVRMTLFRPTFAFYFHRQIEAGIARCKIKGNVLGSPIRGNNGNSSMSAALVNPEVSLSGTGSAENHRSPEVSSPPFENKKRKMETTVSFDSKRSKTGTHHTESSRSTFASSYDTSCLQGQADTALTPASPSVSILKDTPSIVPALQRHLPTEGRSSSEGAAPIRPFVSVALPTGPRKAPGDKKPAVATYKCQEHQINDLANPIQEDKEKVSSELMTSVAQKEFGPENEEIAIATEILPAGDMTNNNLTRRSDTSYSSPLDTSLTQNEYTSTHGPEFRSNQAIVNENGSPIPSRSFRRYPGLDASAFLSASSDNSSDASTLTTPDQPRLGCVVPNSVWRLRRSGWGSPSRSTPMAIVSSSTASRSTSKAVPSSPNAPSRMLQDMVYHRETINGFVDLDGIETIKPADLEDPFCTAFPSSPNVAVLFASDRQRGRNRWTKQNSSGSSDYPESQCTSELVLNDKPPESRNERSCTLIATSGSDASTTLIEELQTSQHNKKVHKRSDKFDQRQGSDSDSVNAIVQRQLDSLISLGQSIDTIVEEYGKHSEDLVSLLERAYPPLHNTHKAKQLKVAREAQAEAVLRALHEIEDERRFIAERNNKNEG